MLLTLNLRALILSLTIGLLFGCKTHSNKDKIIGTWETIPGNQKPAGESLKTEHMKIVLQFNSDLTLVNQLIRNNNIDATYTGTYDFENDQSNLIIYREGKKDRKNTAAITRLTETELSLVDISGHGDTLHLIRQHK